MKKIRQTKSTNAESPKNSRFTFCCGNSQKMLRVMEKFCSSEGPDFNCCTVMHKMCGPTPEKPEKE